MEFDIGLITKFTTTASAIMLVVLTVWDLVDVGKLHEAATEGFSRSGQILNDINLIIVAGVLGLAEFGIEFVTEGFAFVKNLIGRGVFCIFIGTWVFGLNGSLNNLNNGDGDQFSSLHSYALATAIVLTVVGIMYIVFYFMFGEKKAAAATTQ